MAVKVLIVDDHQLFRQGLANLLSDTSSIEIVCHAENGQDAIEKIKKCNPDVVLMDIGMPVMNGVEATKYLQKNNPEIKIIALSMHAEKTYIKGMLEAGAMGYLFKNCSYQQLIDAITTVCSGKKYLSGTITEILIDDYIGIDEAIQDKNQVLTARESEVLKLIAEGKQTREISEMLFVSVKTIGTHKQNILEKLKLKTTTDIVKYALENGIISL